MLKSEKGDEDEGEREKRRRKKMIFPCATEAHSVVKAETAKINIYKKLLPVLVWKMNKRMVMC